MHQAIQQLSPQTAKPIHLPDGSKEFEDFVYLLSHDVRSSVRALVELPQWIEEDLRDEGHAIMGSLKDNMRLMNTHTSRLDRMLVDLLAYSRVGRRQAVTQVCLSSALETVIDEIVVPNWVNIKTEFHLSTLHIGERDILTLLHALVSNAVKHHVGGEALIEIFSESTDAGQVLHVRDDGPGIPAKFREKVMEAMTTLRPRDEVEGSGMGLAIARKIVTLYNGTIRFVDDEGRNGTHLEMVFQHS